MAPLCSFTLYRGISGKGQFVEAETLDQNTKVIITHPQNSNNDSFTIKVFSVSDEIIPLDTPVSAIARSKK